MQSFYIKNSSAISSVTLSAKLGSGGEGTVYGVADNPNLCVKLYHCCMNVQAQSNNTQVAYENIKAKELELKLKAMIEAPPKDPTLAAGHYSICWPSHLVYEDEGCTKFLGFAMPLIDKKIFKEYHLLCDKPGASSSACYRLENFGTGFTYLHMYVVALNLASCVTSIHEAGHAIGDLNDKNILVSTKDSKITIVDCDSFEIHSKDNEVFPCSVYMPEYSAPEVIKHAPIADRQKSDRFALSVLIFKLLMLNTHPYSSRGSSVENLNTPAEKISAGYFPYEAHENLDVEPPVYALPYEIIPPNIRELFKACFVNGQHDPEKRPTAREWFVALKENYEHMYAFVKDHEKMCETNILHIFPLHLQECPWCGMRDDYFPKKIQTNTEKTVINKFDYIDSLIYFMGNDGSISKSDYTELIQQGSLYNFDKAFIDNKILYYRNNINHIVIGDTPLGPDTIIDFGVINQHQKIYNDSILIKNETLLFDMDITIKDIPDDIVIHKTHFSIPRDSEETLTISFLNENVSTVYQKRYGTITIEIFYDNQKHLRSVPIKMIIDRRNTLDKKLHSIAVNPSLLFSLLLFLNILPLFLGLKHNHTKDVIIFVYIALLFSFHSIKGPWIKDLFNIHPFLGFITLGAIFLPLGLGVFVSERIIISVVLLLFYKIVWETILFKLEIKEKYDFENYQNLYFVIIWSFISGVLYFLA